MAITACLAKFVTSSTCLSLNGRTSWRKMTMAPSLSRRVFSMAITACLAKFVTSSTCLSLNGRTSWRKMTMAPIVEGLAQLVEQTGILDGDYGLPGKICHQLDLLVAERPDLLAKDDDGADRAQLA